MTGMTLRHSVRELGDDPIIEEVVEFDETKYQLEVYGGWGDLPSGLFGDLNSHQDFTPFSKFCSLCDEPQTAKVHVSTGDDCDKTLVLALEVIADDMRF